MSETSLQTLIAQALAAHAERPEEARALLARAQDLAPAADAEALAELLRAAEHVLLGHLGDGAAMQEFLKRMPAHDAVQRTRAALALAAGDAAADALLDPLPAAERVRAHYNAALAHTRTGDWRGAAQLVRQAQDHAVDTAARKALAALANNLAADLRYYHRPGHGLRDELMLEAARLARAAWGQVGGWLELERADWQLALCAAAVGRADLALVHARECLRVCADNNADAFERFFAHQALALAHLADADPPAARHERALMAELLPQVPAAERDYAGRALAELDSRLAV